VEKFSRPTESPSILLNSGHQIEPASAKGWESGANDWHMGCLDFRMIEGMFAGGSYATSLELMDVTMARHRALAGNVANVNTPGYQRIDIPVSFMEKLEAAIKTGDETEIKSLGLPEMVEAKGFDAQSADGNNVNLDQEMMFVAENAFAFEMSAQMISNSIRRLETAITGRVK